MTPDEHITHVITRFKNVFEDVLAHLEAGNVEKAKATAEAVLQIVAEDEAKR